MSIKSTKFSINEIFNIIKTTNGPNIGKHLTYFLQTFFFQTICYNLNCRISEQTLFQIVTQEMFAIFISTLMTVDSEFHVFQLWSFCLYIFHDNKSQQKSYGFIFDKGMMRYPRLKTMHHGIATVLKPNAAVFQKKSHLKKNKVSADTQAKQIIK